MTEAADQRPPSVVLVGPPGAGKSTIGRKLARELGVDLYDTDAGIEEETGRTIPEIFAQDGEPEFRRIEEEVVRAAVLAEHGIVSLGGGSVLSAATRELLRGRTVVYLEISVGEGLRRTGASTNRPLLNGDDPAAKYRELMKIRRPLYREVASVRVRTDGRSPGRVVRMILGKLGLESTLPPEELVIEMPTPAAEPGSTGRSRSRRRRRRGRGRGEAQQAATAPNPSGGEPVSAPERSGSDAGGSSDAADAATSTAKPRRRRGRGRGRKNAQPVSGTQSAEAANGTAVPGTEATTPAPRPVTAVGADAVRTAALDVSAETRTAATRSDSDRSGPVEPGATDAASTGASGTRSRRGRRRGRRPAGPAAGGNPAASGAADAHPGTAAPESGNIRAGATGSPSDLSSTAGRSAASGGGPATGADSPSATGTSSGTGPGSTSAGSVTGPGSDRSADSAAGQPDSGGGQPNAGEARPGAGGPATPGAGRSRRARARRARARARANGEQTPDTPSRESEQHP